MIDLSLLRGLLSPSDLILLAIIASQLILGGSRGLIRSFFGLFGRLAAIALAAFGAKLAAPYAAQHLVTPMIGDALQRQVTTALPQTGGTSALSGLSAALQSLIGSGGVKSASQTLEGVVRQATASLSESIAYLLLFLLLIVLFSVLIRILGEALHFFAKKTPLRFVNRLGGALFGAVCGVILCVVILWVLQEFAPALFTEVGVLSPARVSQTLLTKTLLGLIP